MAVPKNSPSLRPCNDFIHIRVFLVSLWVRVHELKCVEMDGSKNLGDKCANGRKPEATSSAMFTSLLVNIFSASAMLSDGAEYTTGSSGMKRIKCAHPGIG